MKYAIVILLGLCAITSAFWADELENEKTLPDHIAAKVEKVIEKITNDFINIRDRIEAIIITLNDQISDLVERAKDKVHAVKADVQKRLDEARKKGGAASDCADKLEPQYVKVEQDFLKDIKVCATEARASGAETRGDVLRGIENIRSHIKNFRSMVKDCLDWNPIVSVKCIHEKINEFKEVVDDIVNSAQAALRTAQFKTAQISSDAHLCNVIAVEKAKAKIENLNEKLSGCSTL